MAQNLKNDSLEKADLARILKKFFANIASNSSVHVRQISDTVCMIQSTKCELGSICLENIKKTGQTIEMIGYKSSFIAPLVKSLTRLDYVLFIIS